MNIISNIRLQILMTSILLSFLVYFFVTSSIPDQAVAQSRLIQIYAFLSVLYLYVTLLATPLYHSFPKFPWRGSYIKARRALGVSAFYFGFLHASLAFGLMGGLAGLEFFTGRFLWALAGGAAGLIILLILTLTSTDWAVRKLGYRTWKFIHRFVYFAALFILFHAFTMGSHFVDLSSAIPVVFLVAFAVLAVLELIRTFSWVKSFFPKKKTDF